MGRRFFTFWLMERDRHGTLKWAPSPFRFRLQRVRDGGPMAFVASALSSFELTYAGPVFNLGPECLESHDQLRRLLKPGDLIVLATRPPLDDPQDKDEAQFSERGERKKPIPRTGWDIETAIVNFLKSRFFDYCSRARLDLKPELIRRLPGDLKNRGALRFYTHGHADITRMQGRCEGKPRPREKNATAGFLIYAPHITPWVGSDRIGPGLLVVFGMGGTETLVWSSLLTSPTCRPTFEQIVTGKSTRVIYGEFVVPRISYENKPPATLSFAQVTPDIFAVLALK